MYLYQWLTASEMPHDYASVGVGGQHCAIWLKAKAFTS